jgi:uncharacterized linocin/CFP29 family protein
MNEMQTVEGLVLGNGANGAPAVFGSVAQRLLANGMNINALRTNDVLHKEEWLLFDRTVVDIARAALVGVADLMAAGLTMPIPGAMGVTVVQHETVSDMSDASVDMSGVAPAERDRVNLNLVNVPLPIFHKDFQLSLRNLMSGRRTGQPIDTTMAATATRKVSDLMEKTLFSGASITSGGGTIYGYTNHPNRNTAAVTASWATTTGENILIDVVAMIGAANADNMYGPYMLYVPIAAYVNMLKDFKANSDKTTLQRILEIPVIKGIKPTSQLAAPNVVLVQFAKDTVDWLDGQQPTAVMWEVEGGMLLRFKVLAIGAPRIKADGSASPQCGIVHFS